MLFYAYPLCLYIHPRLLIGSSKSIFFCLGVDLKSLLSFFFVDMGLASLSLS